MSESEKTQIYLIAPHNFEMSVVIPELEAMLDSVEIACVRQPKSDGTQDDIMRQADQLRDICHKRDIPIVTTDYAKLVEPMGLDGVHLTDGARSVRELRKTLPKDAVIGAYCEASRHTAMTAGEIGADYISFGPVRENVLTSDAVADRDLFAWWSMMIELPVVAEGGFDLATAEALGDVTDFIAIGPEIWGSDDPLATLKAFAKVIS